MFEISRPQLEVIQENTNLAHENGLYDRYLYALTDNAEAYKRMGHAIDRLLRPEAHVDGSLPGQEGMHKDATALFEAARDIDNAAHSSGGLILYHMAVDEYTWLKFSIVQIKADAAHEGNFEPVPSSELLAGDWPFSGLPVNAQAGSALLKDGPQFLTDADLCHILERRQAQGAVGINDIVDFAKDINPY